MAKHDNNINNNHIEDSELSTDTTPKHIDNGDVQRENTGKHFKEANQNTDKEKQEVDINQEDNEEPTLNNVSQDESKKSNAEEGKTQQQDSEPIKKDISNEASMDSENIRSNTIMKDLSEIQVDDSDDEVLDAFDYGEENPNSESLSIDDSLDIDEGTAKIASADEVIDKKDTAGNTPKKKRKKKPIITAIIVILICLLSVAGAWAYSIFNTSFEDEDENAIAEELTAANFNEPFYMLLIGTDTREEGSYKLTDGRSDTCILARIDPVDYVVTMVSIPRDTKITTSDGYTCKFNELYATGGVAATIKQVKKMTGVEISHYAEISFNGLSDMIDSVGGVEVYVPTAIDDPKAGPEVPQGLNNLNGEQALAFSRSRDFADGDFTREADQRILIKALIDKAFKVGTVDVVNLLRAVKNFVKTDLRLGDMAKLATQFMTADTEMKFYSAMIPVMNAGEGGVSYVKVDTPGLKRMLKMVENGEDPSMVELDSGASVGSSRDAQELANKQKEYYAAHPDSPGKISNSSNSDYSYDYDSYSYDNGYSNRNSYSSENYNGYGNNSQSYGEYDSGYYDY